MHSVSAMNYFSRWDKEALKGLTNKEQEQLMDLLQKLQYGKKGGSVVYETILSPVEIGGLTLKNRIVFCTDLTGAQGEELEQKITAIAEGGCAMIIIGDVPVSDRGFFSLSGKKSDLPIISVCVS